MVLVDSSIWIEALRRTGRIEAKVGLEGLLEEYEAALCAPVKLEVLGGARPEDRKRLETWFGCIPYRGISETVWVSTREKYWRLRDQGKTLPWSDVMVATLAMSLGWRVYAFDQHFGVMRDVLGLRLYEPGYGGKYAPDPGG